MIMYLLAAMIRLAYFNVMEEMRRSSDSDGRKYYVGLPVTSAAIVFPTMLLVQYLVQKFASIDVSFIYFIFMSISCIAFVLNFKLRKPGLKAVLVMVAIGVAEAIALVLVNSLIS